MRLLGTSELNLVSGGAGELSGFPGDTTTTTSKKNNNGYGNGPESGPPPGNSIQNPTLLTWNSGPRGKR